MQYLNRRGRKSAYDVAGNVIWLSCATANRGSGPADPIVSLRQSVTRLGGQIARSQELKAEIAAAVDARRYELYRSRALDSRACDRTLAGAQRIHVGNLLKFVHAIASAGPHGRAGRSEAGTQPAPLANSIRQLEASLQRARQLSRDMLSQCRGRDWGGGS